MEPLLRSNIVAGKDWIHQIKWDGIRGLTYIQDGNVQVFTKKAKERTSYYPELQQLTKLIHENQVVLDGEIIVFDQNQKPNFEFMLTRERVKNIEKLNYYTKKYPIQYVVFDILALNGKLITDKPLWERKEILTETLEQNEIIAITDDFADSNKLYNFMKESNWEGIVSKHLESRYLSGKKHSDWFKTKVQKKMLAVICGIQWKQNTPSSLLLGIYLESRLIFIGKASSGLKQSDLQLIKEYSKRLEQQDSPFIDLKNMQNVTWFKPKLTCWVQFLEWTKDKQLRHPQILGFSTQNSKEEIGKEIVL